MTCRCAGSPPSWPPRAASSATSPPATAWSWPARCGRSSGSRSTGMYFYQLLRAAGVFPPAAPASVRMFTTRGQLSPGRADRPVRHRLPPGPRPARGLPPRTAARGGLRHPAGDGPRPGQAVLARPGAPPSRHQLAAPVPGGSGRLETADHAEDRRAAPAGRHPRRRPGPRRPAPCSPSARSTSTSPSGPSTTRPGGRQWAAPCPIRAEEIPHAKELSRRKARMDQRTRERLPVLPALIRAAAAEREAAAARLAACAAARPGEAFTAGGQELRRAVHGQGGNRPDLGRGPGRRQPPRPDPRRAPRLLGLGGHRGPPPYRHQDRGADRAVAPQPGPVPAARPPAS